MIGLRSAAPKPLYLEQYLEQPVETAILVPTPVAGGQHHPDLGIAAEEGRIRRPLAANLLPVGFAGDVEWAEDARRFEDRVKDVVAIAQPSHLQAGQGLAMLDHGEQIGHDLAGVRHVGEAVDDRHRGVGRHFLDLGVIVGAQHDAIDHPAEHPRGIGDGLAPAQLARTRIEDQHAPAQLPHGDVEADAGAGRVLLEHQRQHAALERGIGIGRALGQAHTRRLAINRIIDHRRDIVAPGIAEVEEMAERPRARGHAASGTLKLAAPAESLSKNSSISASPITSGGMMRMVLSPAATVSS